MFNPPIDSVRAILSMHQKHIHMTSRDDNPSVAIFLLKPFRFKRSLLPSFTCFCGSHQSTHQGTHRHTALLSWAMTAASSKTCRLGRVLGMHMLCFS